MPISAILSIFTADDDVNFRLEIAAPWLVKFMSEEFSRLEKEGNFKQIDKHTKFGMVQEFLQERMPKYAKNDMATIGKVQL